MSFIYPKNVDENIAFRNRIIQKASEDWDFAAMVRKAAYDDILFYFNVFCWAYDPIRWRRNKYRPIITFGFQDSTILEINRWIEDGENGLLYKSRDMLASYMVDYVYLHRWHAKNGEEFKIGSRKEEAVDKVGDMDTHFEKFRYQLRMEPKWLLPEGFIHDKHLTYMKLRNPETGSAIIGEATNGDFGRGGRKKSFFFDEFAAWENQSQAWNVGSDATPCKIVVSTFKGRGNLFATLALGSTEINRVKLMWWLHPQKAHSSLGYFEKVKSGAVTVRGEHVVWGEDQSGVSKIPFEPWEKALIGEGLYIDSLGRIRSEWYDKEVHKREPEDVAENLDCNPLGTGRPVFDMLKCDLKMRESKQPIAIGDLNWKVEPAYDVRGNCLNKNLLEVEFIPNMNGLLKIWEHPLDGYENGYVMAADVAEGLEQGDYDSAPVLKRFSEKPEIVAELHGHLKMHDYADFLAKLGTYYKRAFINVERNNHGHAVISQLFRIYPYLWHKEVYTTGIPKLTDVIGFQTSSMSKPIIIGTLGKAIAQDAFVDPDEGFWRETLTFVDNDGKMEAQGKSKGQKCFDDKIMATAILIYTHLTMPLPSRIRIVEPLRGWRKTQADSINDTRLVRWTV